MTKLRINRQETKGMSLAEKLDYCSMPEPNSGCWLWIGGCTDRGYGNMRFDGKNLGAHRMSWKRHNGPIPPGGVICHRCDTPSCINPDHLFLGIQADNIKDAAAKGRMPRGEKSWNAVLTEPQIINTLADNRTAPEIARDHGAAPTTIYAVKSGRTWKHLQKQ